MTKSPDLARRANDSAPAGEGERRSEPIVRRKVELSATVTLSGDALAALLEEVRRIQSGGVEEPLPAAELEAELGDLGTGELRIDDASAGAGTGWRGGF